MNNPKLNFNGYRIRRLFMLQRKFSSAYKKRGMLLIDYVIRVPRRTHTIGRKPN